MVIAAFGFGLIYAVPLGPLGQIMLNRAVEKGFWHGFSIAIIGAIVDFFLCETFLMGTVSMGALNPWLQIILQLAGLIFFLYIGIKEFILPLFMDRKANTATSHKNKLTGKLRLNGRTILGNMFLVAIYYLSNPTYIAFWIAFSVLINQKFISHHTLFQYTLFSLIFSLGSLMSQYISILFVRKIGKSGVKIGILKYASITLYSVTIIYFFYLVAHNMLFGPS
ncbi:LysE family transporter [Desulfonauticus submarinus]